MKSGAERVMFVAFSPVWVHNIFESLCASACSLKIEPQSSQDTKSRTATGRQEELRAFVSRLDTFERSEVLSKNHY